MTDDINDVIFEIIFLTVLKFVGYLRKFFWHLHSFWREFQNHKSILSYVYTINKYLTCLLRSLVGYWVEHSKRKYSISKCTHVFFFYLIHHELHICIKWESLANIIMKIAKSCIAGHKKRLISKWDTEIVPASKVWYKDGQSPPRRCSQLFWLKCNWHIYI